MNGYKAFFLGRTIDVYAESLYQAKLKAIRHFRPVNSKKHLVYVELAEVGGKQVTTTITN